jgi:murein DD-endopeptidase MepM/ murein hydrolase activator NlpD
MKRVFGLILVLFLVACQTPGEAAVGPAELQPQEEAEVDPVQPEVTPFPTRPVYEPGTLVEYTAQTGDSLAALAVRFNTSVEEIRTANPFIPEETTTMPPGMPMKIPIYYAPFWGIPYQILPDSEFVNGPSVVGFDSQEFISRYNGWLVDYVGYAAGDNRTAAQIVDLVALNFSLSPKLLLALIEYHANGLSAPLLDSERELYPLGLRDARHRGLYLQLVWAANNLNNGYYRWRSGRLETFDLLDGRIERPDPWQNAASVAMQFYFSHLFAPDVYRQAIGPDGFALTFRQLYGDPWTTDIAHIPGSLTQPDFLLPFQAEKTWALTGGPHTAWGEGEPLSALDFAPGLITGGCTETDLFATAVADGVVARSEPATVVLDLDGDGDERTGWVVFYFHLAAEGKAAAGTTLKAGDPVGHPSCEGGRATGTHVHIARRYNGEWIPAGDALPFNLEGWVASYGPSPYLGTLSRGSQTVTACTCSDANSHIRAGER